MDKSIILKKGLKSFQEYTIYDSSYVLSSVKFAPYTIYKMRPKDQNYLIYNLYICNLVNRHYEYIDKWFEMLISKEHVEICALLDSKDYSNFLIAKQMIKHKIKEYGY